MNDIFDEIKKSVDFIVKNNLLFALEQDSHKKLIDARDLLNKLLKMAMEQHTSIMK